MRLAYVCGSARRNQATAQKTRDCQQSADWLLTNDIWPIAPLSSSLVFIPVAVGHRDHGIGTVVDPEIRVVFAAW
jgi:hypothetical protein